VRTKKVRFYLDTPFIVRLLDLESIERRVAAVETVELVRKLGGKFAVFEHTLQETYNVIRGAAEYIDRPDGRGAIVIESRRRNRKRTDLLLISEKLRDLLLKKSIYIEKTPSYTKDLQIDEAAFENVLDDEVGYYNEKAKIFDINSVRSIYVQRMGTAPCRLEDARSILVTTNTDFAKAAYNYGKNFESTREVSSVITDFSLANIAWLKSPLKAPDLPAREVVAYAYAALNPDEKLWRIYLDEIDKVEQSGEITARDLSILRYSPIARDELMYLTLGDEESLNKNSVSAILERARTEFAEEYQGVLLSEQESHEATKKELENQIRLHAQTDLRLERITSNFGLICAVGTSILLGLAVLLGTLYSFAGDQRGKAVGVILVLFSFIAMGNVLLGVTVKKVFFFVREQCKKRALRFLLRK
jgi:DNA-binding transcriptional regulator YhcF (GntR family)